MTTLTNFLESNFIDNQNVENKDNQVNQNPIWVLNTQSNNNSLQQQIIKEYIINHAVRTLKPLIHIDLGLSLIKKYPISQYKNILLENGLNIYQPVEQKPYFIIRTPISQRIKKNFLTQLVDKVNCITSQKTFNIKINECNIAKKYENKVCLLVQGIESMILLQKATQLQSFISQLSNLNNSIKQVSILSYQKLMNKQLMFSLQRISTCLTTLTSFNQIQSIWQCISTVRRYTGYSNQQIYTLTFNKNSKIIKVAKKLNIINNQQTKQQKQMVDSLGFVVKKDQQDKRKQEQLKKMIFPHLRIQEQAECRCNGGQCNEDNCKCKENQDQGLIILDDQQQDQDDIDV